jgi:sugar (pentulose or hexulose) kinase
VVLAIDLGTGGPKVAVVSAAGRIVAHAFEPVPLRLVDGGGAEQDPDQWWSAICTAARRAVAEAAVDPGSFIGVGCTAQWLGTVAVDASGDALMPAIIWLDSRGNKAIRRVVSGPVNLLGYDPRKLLRWVQVTGGVPGLSGKDPVAHILFIRDTYPDIYRRTTTFLEPVDYLNLRLTGRTVSSFDTIAAHWVTDNRDIHAVDYDDRLLEATGLDRAQLPDLVSPHRRPTIWVCPRACRWPPARPTSTRRCSARGRWPTSTPTCTSARRRGSRPTSRLKRPPPPATWHPSRPPWPASTSSPTSTRRREHASPSSATTSSWPTASKP